MGGKQVVSTEFRAKDQSVSKAFKRMGKGANRFGNGAENAFKKASRNASKFQSITKSILKASVIQKSFSLLTQGINGVTQSFVGFDDALFSAAAKFSDINLETKKGLNTFKKLGEAARETGRMTQFTAEQAAQALDFMALAGFNAQASMAALPGLADLATAAGVSDFARVVDIATDSLGAFGLATKDTAQLTKNLNRVSDVFAKTQATSNTNVEQLFEAVGKGGPALTLAGQSIETFSALIGQLANSTLKSGEAGTQLRNIILRLADPTKKAASALRFLRVKTKDSNNDFRDLIDIIGDVEKGLKGMGSAQKAQILSTIFGARAITGMGILLKKGAKDLNVYRKGLLAAGGTSKRIAGIMRQSLGNRLKSLGSAANEVGFKFLDAFKVNGVNAIDAFTNSLRTVNMAPIIEGTKVTVKLFIDLFKVMKSVLVITSPLIAAMIAYKTTVIATAVATKGLAFAVGLYNAWRNGTILLTAAQWAFNAALTANPIGLIVGGVALLGTGLFILIKKWDVVKESFISGGQAILNIFSSIFNIVKSIAGFGIGAISGLFGGGPSPASASPGAPGAGVFAPPNKREAGAGAQRFEGLFKFENMPDNVSFESKSFGAPPIQLAGLGAN